MWQFLLCSILPQFSKLTPQTFFLLQLPIAVLCHSLHMGAGFSQTVLHVHYNTLHGIKDQLSCPTAFIVSKTLHLSGHYLYNGLNLAWRSCVDINQTKYTVTFYLNVLGSVWLNSILRSFQYNCTILLGFKHYVKNLSLQQCCKSLIVARQQYNNWQQFKQNVFSDKKLYWAWKFIHDLGKSELKVHLPPFKHTSGS